MKDRLLQLMRSEGLTALKFAEIMEVRPSNISHIISGRNNPGFEFISRFLQRFPDINPDWIINGQGDMYRHGIDLEGGFEPQEIDILDPVEATVMPHTDVTTICDLGLEMRSESDLDVSDAPQSCNLGGNNTQMDLYKTSNMPEYEEDRAVTLSNENPSEARSGQPKATQVKESLPLDNQSSTLNCPLQEEKIDTITNVKNTPSFVTNVITPENVTENTHTSSSKTENNPQSQNQPQTIAKPKAREVIVFYDDNTFEIYKNRSL